MSPNVTLSPDTSPCHRAQTDVIPPSRRIQTLPSPPLALHRCDPVSGYCHLLPPPRPSIGRAGTRPRHGRHTPETSPHGAAPSGRSGSLRTCSDGDHHCSRSGLSHNRATVRDSRYLKLGCSLMKYVFCIKRHLIIHSRRIIIQPMLLALCMRHALSSLSMCPA